MQHEMKLKEGPFEKIKSGKKVIELRLYDEKRQRIKPGDEIVFSKLPDLKEIIRVEVVDLLRYKTFLDLLNNVSMTQLGYPESEDKELFAKSMYQFYSPEEERKYGVLGIKIRLL